MRSCWRPGREKSLRFSERQIRDMGRAARGVRGINLSAGDQVVSMQVFPSDIERPAAPC